MTNLNKEKTEKVVGGLMFIIKYLATLATYFGVISISAKVGECVGFKIETDADNKVSNLDPDSDSKTINSINKRKSILATVLPLLSGISFGLLGNCIVKRIWK